MTDINAENSTKAPRCPHCDGPVWLVAFAKNKPDYCVNRCSESIKEKS